MAQTNLTIRIDDSVKQEAETLFNKLGMSMSGAVNVYFRQAIREQGIPFQPKLNYRHITLKERLKDFSGHYEFEEWNTGAAVGDEVVE